MNNIKLSIVCNTYNHEKYISKALDSFLMQKTNFDFEVLVHDDASTDGTAKVIKRYQNKYPNIIKPIYEKENQYSKGVSINYIMQYPRCKGQYIAFCEGDDYWVDENKLQKQVDFLENNLDYIGCVHKYVVVDENCNEQNIKTFGFYEKSGDYSLENMLHEELPSQLASLVFRNIIYDTKLGYPREFNDVKLQGDIILFLWLVTFGKIYRMKDIMSAYRYVFAKEGTSWSSRSLKMAAGYYTYRGLVSLEKEYKRVYSRKISFKMRKKSAVYAMIFSDFRRVKKGVVLSRAFLMSFLHPIIFIKGVYTITMTRIKRVFPSTK